VVSSPGDVDVDGLGLALGAAVGDFETDAADGAGSVVSARVLPSPHAATRAAAARAARTVPR
jgi:hypothetical protein